MNYLDRPPAGWVVLDVLQVKERSWDWVALMADDRNTTGCVVRIPGKHRDLDAARDALDGMTATRH